MSQQTVGRYAPLISTLNTMVSFLNEKNLVTSLLLCSLLMISIGLSVGLNPHLKVYVMASEETTRRITKTITKVSPEIEVLTPAMEFNELPTLARLGCIDAIIIGDFPNQTNYFAHEAAIFASNIAVLKEYATQGLAKEISSGFSSFPNKVTILEMQELNAYIPMLLDWREQRSTRSLFNWKVDYPTYISAVRVIAILSLVLVFLQTSFMSLIATKSKSVESLPKVAIFAAATFMYVQVIYMACSALIGMPLALHGTTPGVAAISTIGPVSSGSYLRAAFAIMGFVLGIYSTVRRGELTLDKADLALFVITMPIILIFGKIIEPFSISLRSPELFFTADYFPGISSYFGSRGIMVYLIGAISTIMLTRTLRVTRALVFIVSALFVSYGCMRIGDLLPYMTYASITPGIILGFGVLPLFMLVNFLERIIRTFGTKILARKR